MSPSSPPRRFGRWVLAAGLAAGLASWLVGETPLVRPPAPEMEMTVMGRTFQSSTPQGRLDAADADAARFQGIFGATLGLMLGLAGGLSRRSPRAAAVSALVGAAVGALCGLAAARGSLPLYRRLQYTVSNDLIASLAMHGPPFALAGAAGGLALGIALGGRSLLVRSTLGGALGALIGAVVFEFLGALVFPTSETGQPLAASAPARLLAPLIVAAFASLGALGAVAPPRRPSGLG
ncbi:MAG: hypothetical protein P4L85_27760 [Paludisphaera borealis]|uniref:hypothetical protein n=1 Tax=Paludisphaera borealis TaxID=1387353 RepID=UPI002851885E|nr:hypothetical protein [Paludisphaera borealis]MDR3623181.1 hypothetical protein [Paludisphaera borealis]